MSLAINKLPAARPHILNVFFAAKPEAIAITIRPNLFANILTAKALESKLLNAFRFLTKPKTLLLTLAAGVLLLARGCDMDTIEKSARDKWAD